MMTRTLLLSLAVIAVIGCSVIAVDRSPVMSGAASSDDNNGLRTPTLRLTSPALRKQPPGIGHYLAGRAASMRGDHEQAARYFGPLIEAKDDPNPRVQEMLIRHLILSGDVEEAIERARHIQQTDDAEANAASGETESKGERASAAEPAPRPFTRLALITEALEANNQKQLRAHIDKLHPFGLQALIVPFVNSWGDFAQDSQVDRVTIADNLSYSQFQQLQHYHEALQYQVVGNTAMARASYEQALSSLRDVPINVVAAAVRFYAAQDDQARARDILAAYQDLQPRALLWNIADTDAYVEQFANHDGGAVESVQDGMAEVLANIGTLLAQEQVHEDGQILLRLALHLRPDDSLSRLALAMSLQDQGRDEEAIAAYEALDSPAVLATLSEFRIAESRYALGQKARAEAILNDLKGETLASYNLHVMLGDVMRMRERYGEAAGYYSQALGSLDEMETRDWPLLYRRGIMYDLAGNWHKAEQDFREALELNPEEPEVMNYLAYSWLTRDEHLDKAESMLKRAVAARPNNAFILDSYAWALYKQGFPEAALEKLEESLSMAPADPTINDHYGDILWTLGREMEARYHWERALLFEPSEPGAEEALRHKLKHGLSPSGQTRHSDAAAQQ